MLNMFEYIFPVFIFCDRVSHENEAILRKFIPDKIK